MFSEHAGFVDLQATARVPACHACMKASYSCRMQPGLPLSSTNNVLNLPAQALSNHHTKVTQQVMPCSHSCTYTTASA
jgi:hypothetical protein